MPDTQDGYVVAAARDANRRQAEHFRTELHRQSDLLDERMMAYRVALAKYLTRKEGGQVRRVQRELRLASQEHIRVANMLDAIDERFPSDADRTATPLQRQRTPAGHDVGGLISALSGPTPGTQ